MKSVLESAAIVRTVVGIAGELWRKGTLPPEQAEKEK
jgi:hypothetical protein